MPIRIATTPRYQNVYPSGNQLFRVFPSVIRWLFERISELQLRYPNVYSSGNQVFRVVPSVTRWLSERLFELHLRSRVFASATRQLSERLSERQPAFPSLPKR